MDLSKIREIIGAKYTYQEYPALRSQMERWQEELPFNGVTILDATPVFRNTMAKHLTLISGGANLIVGISDIMPFDPTIVKLLKESGIRVVHASERGEATNNDTLFNPDIILDCAASFIKWDAKIGYAELTRSGTEEYRASGKRVFMADSGKIKKIETSLGTGESFFRAMSQIGYSNWSGKRLVVFGSGKVGSGIIAYAKAKGADVVVITDPTTVNEHTLRMVSVVVDFKNTNDVEREISQANFIVSATGIAGAVESCCSPQILINSNAILANMGVEDEFGASIPAERVLEHKRPINFILEEPTQMKYMDATMALHNYGAIALLNEDNKHNSVLLPSSIIEQELLEISALKGLIGEEIKGTI